MDPLKGFAELSGTSRTGRFFRNGMSDRWREVLSPAQVLSVIQTHKDMMRHSGYGGVVDEILAGIIDAAVCNTDATIILAKLDLPSPAQASPVDSKSVVKPQMKLSNKAAHAKSFVPADWKRWIAENLLRGCRADELVKILSDQGYPAELSQLEVDAANSHPYLIAARSVMTKV